MRREGWLVFAAWVLAGALTAFSLLGAASIGLFIAPLAAIAIWLALRLGRAGRKCSAWSPAQAPSVFSSRF